MPPSPEPAHRRIHCAGAVVRRDDGRLLVIQRAQPPSEGLWSIPGGRVEAAESLEAAAVREVREEAGLDIAVTGLLGRLDLPAGTDIYDVSDFAATVVGDPDSAVAGDDAAAVAWVTRSELAALPTTPGLIATLDSWLVWG